MPRGTDPDFGLIPWRLSLFMPRFCVIASDFRPLMFTNVMHRSGLRKSGIPRVAWSTSSSAGFTGTFGDRKFSTSASNCRVLTGMNRTQIAQKPKNEIPVFLLAIRPAR